METDYRKYDLTELRESAYDYAGEIWRTKNNFEVWRKSINDSKVIVQLGSKHFPIPQSAVEAMKRFHDALDMIDCDTLLKKLERFDYIENDPIDWVEDAKKALGYLRKYFVMEYRYTANCIDPELDNTRRRCIKMANWLGQQIPILKERRRAAYDAPTDAEKEMLKDLLEWDIEEWLDEYLFSDADLSVDCKKRILRLALNTDGVDEGKRERLNQVLAQLEQEITKTHQGVKQADRTSNTIEKETQNHAKQKNDSHQQRQAKKKSFTDIIQYKEEGLTDAESKAKVLNRLHELIDGKRGAKVGATLLKAQQDGLLITCPTQAEFEDEFKLIGTWQAIHNYMSDNNPNALELAYKIIIFSSKN